jgi:hypothetical protein
MTKRQMSRFAHGFDGSRDAICAELLRARVQCALTGLRVPVFFISPPRKKV